MKILNLYAGIGGNRKLWGAEHKVTAVEINSEIAEVYKKYFPEDEVIIGDAHEFLLHNYRDYDFIWSSPPCQTHSRARWWGYKNTKPKYPDMKLWQEIIFLKYHATQCKWVVENVVPYYPTLIKPTARIGRHYFWSNFAIPSYSTSENYTQSKDSIINRAQTFGYDPGEFRMRWLVKKYAIRNMVDPEIGLHILKSAIGDKKDIFYFTGGNINEKKQI